MRIDLVGQLCAGDVCASAGPAASAAAKANAADHIETLRILASRSRAPSPLVGEGWGGGSCRGAQSAPLLDPHPRPLPTRGRGEEAYHKLLSRPPSRLSETPVM